MIADDEVTEIEKVIDLGVKFLISSQLGNGEFSCDLANNDAMLIDPAKGNWAGNDSGCIFPAILIGNSLMFLKNEKEVAEILSRIKIFLLNNRRYGSVWNHFTKNNPRYWLCPFDIDDTSCASVLLKNMGAEFPSNEALLLSNNNGKGLYYSWFTFRKVKNSNLINYWLCLRELLNPIKSYYYWKKMECDRDDIDAIVNVNLLFYLGERPETETLIDYVIDLIVSGRELENDKWYRNRYTIYYFISRIIDAGISKLEGVRTLIAERVTEYISNNGSVGNNVLDTALMVCTLYNLKYCHHSLPASVNFLQKKQRNNGSWEKWVFYYGGPKKLMGWGSETLTTALCLEALSRFERNYHSK